MLRRESRSVGHPRRVLCGVESPWLLEQPELQRSRERAWPHEYGKVERVQYGIMGTTSWAHQSIMGTTSWAQQGVMGSAEHHGPRPAIFSFLENTDRHLRGEKQIKRDIPPSVRVVLLFFHYKLLLF